MYQLSAGINPHEKIKQYKKITMFIYIERNIVKFGECAR